MTESKANRAARLAKKELEEKIPAPDFLSAPRVKEKPVPTKPATHYQVKNLQREVINGSCGCIESGKTGKITVAEYAVYSKFVEKV